MKKQHYAEPPYFRGFWAGSILTAGAIVAIVVAWPQTVESARHTVGIPTAHAEAPSPAGQLAGCFGLTLEERIQVEDTQEKLAGMRLPAAQESKSTTVKLSPARQEGLSDDDRRTLAAAGLL